MQKLRSGAAGRAITAREKQGANLTMLEFDLPDSPLAGANLIEAGAGTGKTYTITGLVLRLIIEKDIPLEEILVVTFTEAATCELKDRIRMRLRDAHRAFSRREAKDPLLARLLEKHPDADAARRKLGFAVNDFDRASIFTIHGFCMRTLLDHAFASTILFDAELATDEQTYIREVVQDFWRSCFYKASSLFFNHARKALGIAALTELARRTANSANVKIVPSSLRAPDCSTLEEEFRRQFGKACECWRESRDAVAEMLSTHPGLNRSKYRKNSIPDWIVAMDAFLSGECLDCLLCKGFEKFTIGELERGTKSGKQPPAHPLFQVCEDLLRAAQNLRAAYDEKALGLKIEFLTYLRQELEARKSAKSVLFFNDLLVKLQHAVAGPGGEFMSAIVGRKYKAALIDEFQDTDSIQYDIFHRVFGTTPSSTKSTDTQAPVLFLIGDPKQAIYGFRGADIFTYMDAADKTPSRFTLTENWRSEPGLIEAVNAVFGNNANPFVFDRISFPPARPASAGERQFLTIDGEKPPPLRIWYLRPEDDSNGKPVGKGEAAAVIARSVAAEISRLLVRGREKRLLIGERPVRRGDIAVLVRKNREALLVQETLAQLGIHSVLFNMGNLFESREAVEVQRVISAVANPADERLIRSALVTELIGVGGEELDRLSSDENGWDLWLARFGEYHETWSKYGFFRMFRALLTGEKVLPRLMSLTGGERRCTNILHLSEVLHGAAVENNLSMVGLVKWLAMRRSDAGPATEEHQLRLESDENAVKLITIHKSKGLEYPIVFCPFAWDGSRVKGVPFTFHDQASADMALTLDLGSPDLNNHRNMAEREQLAENLRLLYVALTRARHRCYLVWGHINEADTSAPAYLFHHRALGDWNGLPDAMETRIGALDDDSRWKDLEEIAAGSRGAIHLCEIPRDAGAPMPPLDSETAGLTARSFHGVIDRNWKISSYTSLVHNKPHKAELSDRDEALLQTVLPDNATPDAGAGPGEPGRKPPREPDIFSLPGSAATGTLLHEIFEHLDFTSHDDAAVRELVSTRLARHGYDKKWVGPVHRMVQNVLTVDFDSEYGSFTLSRVHASQRFTELEFYFPLNRLAPDRLREVLARCVRSGDGPATDAPSNIEALALEPFEGYMKGFIDLVFRIGERFYILDWKSNKLGEDIECYSRDALQEAILDNFYNLQYYLYTLALHQYLEARMPGYDYESHFGEVFYVFLRGVDPAMGPRYGIYRDRPPLASIEALRENLISREGTGL